MTDRELLELAAKAAGIVNYDVTNLGVKVHPGSARGCGSYYWNPLTDDGDALRLAVKLEIEISTHSGEASVFFYDGEGPHAIDEALNNDPYAATRRAIVRAAAEIGKEMK